MRKLFLIAFASLFVMAAPATAKAAVVHAESGAGGHGHILNWSADYDTVAHTVTLDVTHTKFDGSTALGVPQQADIILTLPNGTTRDFDLLTLRAVSDGQPGVINKGPQTYSVQLRVSADRASLIEFETDYIPPLGA